MYLHVYVCALADDCLFKVLRFVLVFSVHSQAPSFFTPTTTVTAITSTIMIK